MAIPSVWDERKILVFVTLIVIAAAVALLEVDAARHGRQSPVDEMVAGVLTPIQSAIAHASASLGGEAAALIHANSYAAENAQLRAKILTLAGANERLKDHARENRVLRRMLAMAQDAPRKSVAADVVGYAPESPRKEITIDRGWRDGVRTNDVVVGGSGLVGHVIDTGRHESHVLLITDPASAVPAYMQRTGSWGIVSGTLVHAKMKYINQDARVLNGDLVVTGRGEVYPPGLPIGRVIEVDKKDNALYQTALLQPLEDFSSLAHVLVLLAK